MTGARRWLLDHDDRWSFVVPYLVLAVVLSIWISLFWLVVVVAGHGVVEWIRHKHLDPAGKVLGRVLWEIKLDIALIIFSLALAVYMEFILGVAGLGGAARVGIRTGARFAGYERAIRGALLSVDDAAQLLRAAGSRLSKKNGDAADEDAGDDGDAGPSARRRLGFGDYVAFVLGGVCLAAILIAPAVVDTSYLGMLATFVEELHPWP